MSISLSFEDGSLAEVSSNSGWAQFRAWAAKAGGAVAQFVDVNYADDAEALLADLEAKLTSADSDARSVAEEIAYALRGEAGGVAVTDGLGS